MNRSYHYTIYNTDGSLTEFDLPQPIDLNRVHHELGGPMELVRIYLNDRWQTVAVNEEGIMLDLPRNRRFIQFLGPVLEGYIE